MLAPVDEQCVFEGLVGAKSISAAEQLSSIRLQGCTCLLVEASVLTTLHKSVELGNVGYTL